MSEPAIYQYRMRATWNENPWSPWVECTEGTYNDCIKSPLVNDWAYEARKLFAEPFDIEPPRYAKRLINQLKEQNQHMTDKVDHAIRQCEISAAMFDTDDRGVRLADMFHSIKTTLTK